MGRRANRSPSQTSRKPDGQAASALRQSLCRTHRLPSVAACAPAPPNRGSVEADVFLVESKLLVDVVGAFQPRIAKTCDDGSRPEDQRAVNGRDAQSPLATRFSMQAF